MPTVHILRILHSTASASTQLFASTSMDTTARLPATVAIILLPLAQPTVDSKGKRLTHSTILSAITMYKQTLENDDEGE